MFKIFCMATVLTPFYNKMFTSEFSRLDFKCTGASMVFSIEWEADEIFSQEYFPDDDHIVTVYDIDKLLESYFDGLCDSFDFFVDGALVKHVSVFTCRINISESADTFYTDFFFTPCTGERDTALGRYETLTLYAGKNTSVDAVCTYFTADETLVTKTKHIADTSVGLMIDVSPSKFIDDAGELVSYVIHAGARYMPYRVLESVPDADPAFIFKNCFGCWETIYLIGAKETVPTYTRSNAVVGGNAVMYDIQEVMSYKADTGPLRPGMVPADLARAKDVFLLKKDGTAGDRITITEVDVKHTNEDNSLPDFTFTYRRADRRSSMIDVVRPPKLFDDTFDETYE